MKYMRQSLLCRRPRLFVCGRSVMEGVRLSTVLTVLAAMNSFSQAQSVSSHSSISMSSSSSSSSSQFSRESRINLMLGSTVRLRCGVPTGADARWYRLGVDGKKTEIGRPGTTSAGDGRIKFTFDGKASIMEIPNSKMEDSGTYLCESVKHSFSSKYQVTFNGKVGSDSGCTSAHVAFGAFFPVLLALALSI